MSISIVNGPKNPSKPETPVKTDNPHIKSLQHQKERIDKQISQEQEREKTREKQKKTLASHIREIVLKSAADPNDDPQELFDQVRPLLQKLMIANMTDAGKTELIVGKTQGPNSYYKITLRRNAVIDTDKIDRIKREEKFFDSLVWTSQAMCLYVWWPYKATEEGGGI